MKKLPFYIAVFMSTAFFLKTNAQTNGVNSVGTGHLSNLVSATGGVGHNGTNGGNLNGYYGTRNLLLGYATGGKLTSGHSNNFIGYAAGQKTTTGSENFFIGAFSGGYNTTGTHNIFIGMNSGNKNTTGGRNIFIGTSAGRNTKASSSNAANVFIGHYVGQGNTSGIRNTYLGHASGARATGSGNVFLGHASGLNELGSNKLYIDNSSTSKPLIYGDFATNQLGIDTNHIPSGFTFAVGGKAIVAELQIEAIDNWPDYVFTKNYSLPTLETVETHILTKGHLPNIPTAKEVATKGIAIGEMNAKLLEKIEELMLYVIQQQKANKQLRKEFEVLKAQIKD